MGDNKRIRFPFSRLPKGAQQNTIKVMDPLESLGLSTLSKKTKELVESSGLKCHSVTLCFSNPIDIHIEFFNAKSLTTTEVDVAITLYGSLYDGVRVKQKERELFSIGTTNETDEEQLQTWTLMNNNTRRLSQKPIQDWIKHLLSVLNEKHIEYVEFRQDFNLDLIRGVFSGLRVKMLSFGNEVSRDFTTNVIRNIAPPEELKLGSALSGDEFKKISMQNFCSLSPSNAQNITFDDLLSINAAQLTIRTEKITEKQINRIIKLWIRGSYPRLERLKMTAVPHLESFDVARIEILKGIACQERKYPFCGEVSVWFEDFHRDGNQPMKFVIIRSDGKEAILKLECTSTMNNIWLLVCS